VQRQLRDHGIAAALEKSKRGGHLWMFFEQPVMARHARTYIYHVAKGLGVQVKGAGLSEGIEIFPKQDELRPEEFGNAIRAPLGVHWGARESRGWRYWYYGADYKLVDQLAYLNQLPKVKEDHLQRMIAGMVIPQEFVQRARRTESPKYFESKPGEFRILDHVEVRRQAGRNWVTRRGRYAAWLFNSESWKSLRLLASAGCQEERKGVALMGNLEQQEPRGPRPGPPSLAARGERRRIERRLQEVGVLCQPEVS